MFRDRDDAALQLAQRLKSRALKDPLVLAIPRGGVVTGAVLARELGAELDVVLARKLRAPGNREYAIGGIAEDGHMFLNRDAEEVFAPSDAYLEQEHRHQLAEMERRKKLYRDIRPAAAISGRSVIVTDDGIATGSTMSAALPAVRQHNPYELIVAVPVAPPERIAEIQKQCDAVVCLATPPLFWAVGQFYEHFAEVNDDQVVRLLRAGARPTAIHR